MIELNMNLRERYYRFVLGLLLILSGFVWYSPVHFVLTHTLSFIGFIMIFTGATGWCPFYSQLNFSTLEQKVMGKKITKLDLKMAVVESPKKKVAKKKSSVKKKK